MRLKNFRPGRRRFLNQMLAAGGAFSLPLPSLVNAQQSFNGKLVLALQMDGGADVTSLCDPKTNVAGEMEINRWARDADPIEVGNLVYAPYAENEAFFEKYYRDILVINGVDAQTNSHSVGVVNNWSGRNSLGFPTVTSLYAANKAPDFPMAYLNFGGFGAAENLVSVTRVSDPNVLRGFVAPNQTPIWANEDHLIAPSRFERIKQLHAQTAATMTDDSTTVGGNYRNRRNYLEALTRTDGIQRFADYIPSEEALQETREFGVAPRMFFSNLHQQIQIALLAFKAQVAVSADLFEGGFDTHENHDDLHPLLYANVTDAIDYLWTYAGELGLDDRLVLLVGTDFGRTPHFNASEGKDHWPIGSYLVMEKGARYTNRMLGETDEGHNALKISPRTGKRDDADGVIVKPAHVHKALRKYLGIDSGPVSSKFAFNNIEDFRFFS